MNLIEPIGYLASALVLAAFCMRDMVALRRLAIASNLAFIAYGALAGLGPVLLLHLMLLPVNLMRLVSSRRRPARDRCADACKLQCHVTLVPPARGCAPSPWLGRVRARRMLASRRMREPHSCSPPRQSAA